MIENYKIGKYNFAVRKGILPSISQAKKETNSTLIKQGSKLGKNINRRFTTKNEYVKPKFNI